jgi:hypothetical protein
VDISDLVALVYRADWKQLNLSATISHTFDPEVDRRLRERKSSELRRAMGPLPRDSSQRAPRFAEVDDEVGRPVHTERHVLIAPGGRYRVESDPAIIEICDGEHCWSMSRGVAHRELGPRPGSDFHGLLTPQWLIASYELQVIGAEVVGDRAAIRVTGIPRAAASTRRSDRYHFLDRIEVLIDAELGILLRSRQIFEGQSPEFAELRDLAINPSEAGISSMFALPPDVPVEEEEEAFADYQPPSGVGWQVAGAAAGAAANALGFAVRHAPRRKAAWPTDEEPDVPEDAVLPGEDWEQRQPPDDRTVNLLHRTSLPAPALTAEVHEWIDVLPSIQNFKEFREKMPAPLEGIFGPDAVWDALGERAAEYGHRHRVTRLAVQLTDRYRLDYLSGDWNKRYKAIACDGEHTTKLFDDRVATGPVKRLDARLAFMLDPAWLLNGWRLAVIGSASVAGRNGIRIQAIAARPAHNGADDLSTRADVVVDAELGILLRKTTYVNDHLASRTEFRDLRALDKQTSFRIVPGPGMRSVTESGGPLADLNLPRAAEAAATTATAAATLAAAGAVAVTGWLDKHRARRDRR